MVVGIWLELLLEETSSQDSSGVLIKRQLERLIESMGRENQSEVSMHYLMEGYFEGVIFHYGACWSSVLAVNREKNEHLNT